MAYYSEVYLVKKSVSPGDWQNFITTISSYNGKFKKWRLIVESDNNQFRFYIETRRSMPATINGLDTFLMRSCLKVPDVVSDSFFTRKLTTKEGLLDVINYCEIKNKGDFKYLVIEFKQSFSKLSSKIEIYLNKRNNLLKYKVITNSAADLLKLNVDTNKRFFVKTPPKYLDISKLLHLLSTDPNSSILQVDTFPYLQGDFFINQSNFSFDKHSVVFGASGCGKSKFLSLFIYNIYKNINLKQRYKVVFIDPHAALEKDIGGIGRVIDFKNPEDTVDLFINDCNDVIASVELMVELFKTLIADQYNSKLERVLRHSLHLLLTAESFNFTNLRKLLLELEYRNNLVNQYKNMLPMSVTDFFMTDFNDLKTKSYGEAISPLIGFVDEMEMLPVFNDQKSPNNISDVVRDNFLTIFSLDRTKLGDKVVKTIAGLIMQQILTIIQKRDFDQHIIFIIDEIAVVENPILSRFLSEARKYNLSLMLAGQYFSQISEELKNSIFANVINYYIFRISKLDANVLVDNFNIKIPLSDTRETKLKLLTELNNRECVVRVAADDILLPAFKAKTLNFVSIPRKTNPAGQREYLPKINHQYKNTNKGVYSNFYDDSNTPNCDFTSFGSFEENTKNAFGTATGTSDIHIGGVNASGFGGENIGGSNTGNLSSREVHVGGFNASNLNSNDIHIGGNVNYNNSPTKKQTNHYDKYKNIFNKANTQNAGANKINFDFNNSQPASNDFNFGLGNSTQSNNDFNFNNSQPANNYNYNSPSNYQSGNMNFSNASPNNYNNYPNNYQNNYYQSYDNNLNNYYYSGESYVAPKETEFSFDIGSVSMKDILVENSTNKRNDRK